jgi:predicted MFS family arabinose efflux permease
MRSIKQITFSILLIAALALAIFIYQFKPPDSEYETTLTREESLAMFRKPKSNLQLLATISFQVSTNNTLLPALSRGRKNNDY